MAHSSERGGAVVSELLQEALEAWEVVHGVLEESIKHDLCGKDEVREGREQLDCIGAALKAGCKESAAFEAYGRAHEVTGPSIFFSYGKWRGFITDEMSSLCTGDSYAEVHSKLAKWCSAQVAA